MLGDDDDVFDSVTWESPSNQPYSIGGPSVPTGPGFIQSTEEVEPGQGPNDPKWEGYLITTVKDPLKELAETKDAYVSYLVTATVRMLLCLHARILLMHSLRRLTFPSSQLLILRLADDSQTLCSSEITWQRTSQHA